MSTWKLEHSILLSLSLSFFGLVHQTESDSNWFSVLLYSAYFQTHFVRGKALRCEIACSEAKYVPVLTHITEILGLLSSWFARFHIFLEMCHMVLFSDTKIDQERQCLWFHAWMWVGDFLICIWETCTSNIWRQMCSASQGKRSFKGIVNLFFKFKNHAYVEF